MGELVDARMAAERLGVDVRTLYAYVSRGSLRRVPGPDGRSSRYDSDDLELLAQRSRPRTLPRPTASIDLVIATRVSTVTDGVVRYRGKDVLDLVAAGASFEVVADLLWRDAAGDWPHPAAAGDAVTGFLGALGTSVPVLQRFAIAIAIAALPASTLPSSTLPAPQWAIDGRWLIACLTEAAGKPRPASSARDLPRGVASRLWERWSPLRPTPARVRALNTALVLLAEHELALSTLSVRVAASARAAPGACVLAGLSTLSGALHGGVGRVIHEMLAARAGGGGPELPLEGVALGHLVHRHGDPRTGPLLDAIDGFATPADRDLIAGTRRAAQGQPNVDFALGALTYAARMPPEAATAIFAIARTAGWIAHAAEEYGEPALRFRGHAFRKARTRPGPA
ncbi:MAG TPA: citrate synthase [Trebonia sp.]|jgi:citrate synthase|nr:citrate synthase [Trebonia sp.]